MSKIPSIPEFTNSPDDLSTALRAVKQVVEQITGQRQGESKGAPQVFVQATEPKPALRISYKTGDFWIDTSTNTLKYWTGSNWQALA